MNLINVSIQDQQWPIRLKREILNNIFSIKGTVSVSKINMNLSKINMKVSKINMKVSKININIKKMKFNQIVNNI